MSISKGSFAVAFLVLFFISSSVFAGTVNLRQTGQTTPYGTRDDGALRMGVAWPSLRLQNNGNTITDNLTGLIWTIDANPAGVTLSWQQALDYVSAMNAGAGTYGYTDWRMPNVNEILSLMDMQQANNYYWLTAGGFLNVGGGLGFYWTSTTYPWDTSTAFYMHAGVGGISNATKTTQTMMNVWPVRGGGSGTANVWKTGQTTPSYQGDDGTLQKGVSWPSPRFKDNGNGTVTDNLTGLVWLKNADCWGNQDWPSSLAYANTLASGQCGLTDGSGAGQWRLPNWEELRSLTDYSMHHPALPSGHPFNNVVSVEWYWASTTYADTTANAWVVGMYDNY